MVNALTDADYERLLRLRTDLRRFLRWSEEQAEVAGITPVQHQLLLAVRGHPGPDAPTVGDLAGSLLLRHHSVVGLIDRAEEAGLVRRRHDRADRRVVRVALTARGRHKLASLTAEHVVELRQVGARFAELAATLD
jgi:DNA-binding MarR family transcriptional regulator